MILSEHKTCVSFFLCSMHHFPNYFSCIPSPDELLNSLPANSSMQLTCPSIIPSVHCLLPEHNPRICLAVVLVAWRLFQSLWEQFSCLTWVPDAIWEALRYLSHPSELITQDPWETYTLVERQVEMRADDLWFMWSYTRCLHLGNRIEPQQLSVNILLCHGKFSLNINQCFHAC